MPRELRCIDVYGLLEVKARYISCRFENRNESMLELRQRPFERESAEVIERATFQLRPNSLPPWILERCHRSLLAGRSKPLQGTRVVVTSLEEEFGKGGNGEIDGTP